MSRIRNVRNNGLPNDVFISVINLFRSELVAKKVENWATEERKSEKMKNNNEHAHANVRNNYKNKWLT